MTGFPAATVYLLLSVLATTLTVTGTELVVPSPYVTITFGVYELTVAVSTGVFGSHAYVASLGTSPLYLTASFAWLVVNVVPCSTVSGSLATGA